MALWGSLNRSVFKKTSTFFLAAALGTFFFERAFEMGSVTLFERLNRGKLWKDIKDRYEHPE